jgi:SAM-dependent methyltransferase
MASLTQSLERVIKLLDDPPAEPRVVDGYLDLLGRPPAPSLAQRVMQSTLLPRIYEDIWRPVGFNLAKGWPFGPSTAEEFAQARSWLGLDGGPATVLDVACGPGNVTRGLHEGVSGSGLVAGIDMSPTMLARAVEDTDAANVGYVRGDAAHLPFTGACFDAVCCFGAMYLFSDPWAALDSMTRVLRPGGRIVILTSRSPRLPFVHLTANAVGQSIGMTLFGDEEVTAALTARGYHDVNRRAYPLMQMVGATLG